MIHFNKQSLTTDWLPGSLLFGALLLCLAVMWPALPGPFIFDDTWNLEPLGKNGGIRNWQDVYNFMATGASGPLGRPLALLTFVFNDQTWPSFPEAMRYTNILIHLLNGVLLFAVLQRLLVRLVPQGCNDRSTILWLSLIGSALWVLHPIQQTAVFPIIQRMTLLSATFSLAGIIFYLKAREVEGFGKQFVWLGVTALCLLLGVFSKEVALVTALYIMLIEFIAFSSAERRDKPLFRFLAYAYIFLFVLYMVAVLYKGFSSGSLGRDYTTLERLYTQGRVILQYMGVIILPAASKLNFFQDGIAYSTGILSPITTLLSWLLHIALIVTAIKMRVRFPLISFGVLWFYLGHSLESTVINLELYFGHRNYLPLLGWVVAALGVYLLVTKKVQRLLCLGVCLILSLYIFVGFINSKVWSDRGVLISTWIKEQPNSFRTNREYVRYLLVNGDTESAYYHSLDLVEKFPGRLLTMIDVSAIACEIGIPQPIPVEEMKKTAATTGIEAVLGHMLINMVDNVKADRCVGLNHEDMIGILRVMLDSDVRLTVAVEQYINWEIASYEFTSSGVDSALVVLEDAWEKSHDAGYKYLQALYLAASGQQSHALEIIAQIRREASRKTYLGLKPVLDELEQTLRNELEADGIETR